MKKIILLIGTFSIITLYGQDNTFPTTGNVGIGTNNPHSKLEVNGDITLGNITSHEYNVVFRPDDNSWRSALVGYSSSIAYDDYIGLKTKFGTIRFITNDGYESARIANGRLGIGTTNPQATLDVAGTSSFSGNMKVDAKLEAKEIKVTTTPTADFVFGEDYHLPKLEELERHIKDKKHLPEIASATEMEKEGVNVGEFQIKLLQKIEELTLYTIEQNKQNKLQEEQIKIQQEQIKQLEVQNKELLELKKMVQELNKEKNK